MRKPKTRKSRLKKEVEYTLDSCFPTGKKRKYACLHAIGKQHSGMKRKPEFVSLLRIHLHEIHVYTMGPVKIQKTSNNTVDTVDGCLSGEFL